MISSLDVKLTAERFVHETVSNDLTNKGGFHRKLDNSEFATEVARAVIGMAPWAKVTLAPSNGATELTIN